VTAVTLDIVTDVTGYMRFITAFSLNGGVVPSRLTIELEKSL
jgi:hypothetical protein